MNSKFQLAASFFILAFCIGSCSLLDPAANLNSVQQPSNKVIVNSIEFNLQKSSISTDWSYCEIQHVNINHYSNIDSIIFTPNMRSQRADEHCIVELYNFDENKSVPNSHVESTVRYTLHYGRSSNMISTFPKEGTRIGIRFRSSKDGHYIEVGIGSRVLIYSH